MRRETGLYGVSWDDEAWNEFLERKTERSRTAFRAGQDHRNRGDLFKSWAALSYTARLNGLKDDRLNFSYAMACLDIGAFEIARKLLEALSLKYDRADISHALILAYLKTGRLDLMRERLKKHLSLFEPSAFFRPVADRLWAAHYPGKLPPKPIGKKDDDFLPLDDDARISKIKIEKSRDLKFKKRFFKKRKGIALIIPVFNAYEDFKACAESVFKTLSETDLGTVEIVIVDDASTDPRISALTASLGDKITLIRHEFNQGFPASVNTGLVYARGRDVVLLNSDTVLFDGFFKSMARHLSGGRDIATVTPMSNAGGLSSYPECDRVNDIAPEQARIIARAFARNGFGARELPVGNGFCLGITAKALAEIGKFDAQTFGVGYGEEVDFCLRASKAGYRHIAATDLFVFHKSSASMENARALNAHHQRKLENLYPDWTRVVDRFLKRDPLLKIRRAVDMDLATRTGKKLIVTHALRGGVERLVNTRKNASFILEPSFKGCVLRGEQDGIKFENLKFELPKERDLLTHFLKSLKLSSLEIHHLAGHAPCILELIGDLDLPTDVYLHDHSWFCPRAALLDGSGRYCGERGSGACGTCLAALPKPLERDISASDLQIRSAELFARARRIFAPTYDTARRFKRYFPDGAVEIAPWQDDAILNDQFVHAYEARKKAGADKSRKPRIAFVGALSRWKGAEFALEFAREIKRRGGAIELFLAGTSINEELLEREGVTLLGPYFNDLGDMMKIVDPDYAFLPSLAPETWSFAFSDAIENGIPVLAFDIGALPERLRGIDARAGIILPLGMGVKSLVSYLERVLNCPYSNNRPA